MRSATYDFAALGIPGLTFGLRYVKGDYVDASHISTSLAAGLRARGDEHRVILSYVFNF